MLRSTVVGRSATSRLSGIVVECETPLQLLIDPHLIASCSHGQTEPFNLVLKLLPRRRLALLTLSPSHVTCLLAPTCTLLLFPHNLFLFNAVQFLRDNVFAGHLFSTTMFAEVQRHCDIVCGQFDGFCPGSRSRGQSSFATGSRLDCDGSRSISVVPSVQAFNGPLFGHTHR